MKMAKFILYKDDAREFRWRFKASNGKIIADSGEGYINKQDAVNGISFIRKYAAGADFEDLTIQRW